ncbi:MAG: hypothetical protein LBL66_02785 [Clostridiales bacterium]|nr:hypothetical protein [Clostridiales bacterium]
MHNCGWEKNARGVSVFGRDCRVALCAPRNDKAIHNAQCTIAVGKRMRGAFLCLVGIAASRFALLAMTGGLRSS